jgi:hypothetical protein
VSDLTQTSTLIAIASVLVALVAIVMVLVLTRKLRQLKADQKVIMGGGEKTDLVTHAADLQRAFGQLQAIVDETAESVQLRVGELQDRLDRSLALRGLIRYDAYGEMTGQQSSSLALLDKHLNGFVITTITNRDSARMYFKGVVAGEGERELSPEEAEAVAAASERPASLTA